MFLIACPIPGDDVLAVAEAARCGVRGRGVLDNPTRGGCVSVRKILFGKSGGYGEHPYVMAAIVEIALRE